MPRPSPLPTTSTCARLHAAALQQVASHGPLASVRSITKAAGVTEGALYRHYESRGHLLGAVFAELVRPMVAEKEALVAMRAPIDDRLREWVRCTYARFDKDPDGFAYIFLTTHTLPKEYQRLSGRQSELLRELLAQGQALGVVRSIPADVAAALFVGLLLSVPTQIRQGGLKKPALNYVDEVARAIWLAVGTTQSPGGAHQAV